MKIIDELSEDQKRIVDSVKNHAEKLIDHSPRFKYFTLHGSKHINSLINIADIFFNNGVSLTSDEIFLLLISICVHDLGMVVPLREATLNEVLGERNQLYDPTRIESFIRENHQNLIDGYLADHFDFLTSLGLSPSDCGLIKRISRCHRKTELSEESGCVKNIGALLRIIDEFDIGPERAPAALLVNNYKEMDATSCWHWFKHNIAESWRIGHNVIPSSEMGRNIILFKLIVYPPLANSIPYWLNQINKGLFRVLKNEGTQRIVKDYWNTDIRVEWSEDLSKENQMGDVWLDIYQKSFSHGGKKIILIDDEARKMEDLFLNLSKEYYLFYSPDAKDALTKIQAVNIDLAIVDMQIGSGGLWSREETKNYKATGKKLCEEILKLSPDTKLAILTGTRYDTSDCDDLPLSFFISKPIDPIIFEERVNHVLK